MEKILSTKQFPYEWYITSRDLYLSNNNNENTLCLFQCTLNYVISLGEIFNRSNRFTSENIRKAVFEIIYSFAEISPQITPSKFSISFDQKSIDSLKDVLRKINLINNSTKRTNCIIHKDIQSCSEYDIFLYLYSYLINFKDADMFQDNSRQNEVINNINIYIENNSKITDNETLIGKVSRTNFHNYFCQMVKKMNEKNIQSCINSFITFIIEYNYILNICKKKYNWLVVEPDNDILNDIIKYNEQMINTYSKDIDEFTENFIKFSNLHKKLNNKQMLPNAVFNSTANAELIKLDECVNEFSSVDYSERSSNIEKYKNNSDDTSSTTSSSNSSSNSSTSKKEIYSFYNILLFIGIFIIIIFVIYIIFKSTVSTFYNKDSRYLTNK